MYLPRINNIKTSREGATEFRGYNHTYNVNSREFYDMQNMSGRNYPALSPRVQRFSHDAPDGRCYLGIHAHDKLCWVCKETLAGATEEGCYLYYDGGIVGVDENNTPKLTLSDTEKRFVNMGARILIWPDKIYYNTSDGTFGKLENTVTTTESIALQLCKVDATDYQDYTTSDTAPSDPTDGQLWMNTSVTPHVLSQYSVLYLTWQSISTTYIKLSMAGIGKGFKAYDAVTISGAANAALNGDFILYGVTDDYIVITGTLDQATTETAAVTISRKVPDLDFITEQGNRIWGCSSDSHEIYACKLGDPTNWYYYTDQSTASYSATVGSPGDFTGCYAHMGYVLFFKENEILTLRGTKPSNYQLDSAKCRGIEKGSEKSIALVNETLYYKSAYDICAYGASQPSPISDALGNKHYKNAVAGALGSVYYICMEDDDRNYVLFTYDDKRGLWHKQDCSKIIGFAAAEQELWFLKWTGVNWNRSRYTLENVSGTPRYTNTSSAVEPPVEWFAETGDIGNSIPNNKYISKLQFRMEVPEGSMVKIELQYDSDGHWVEKYRMNATRKRSFTVPVVPRRCDHMKVRISGTGDCKIYSFVRTTEEGSEIC